MKMWMKVLSALAMIGAVNWGLVALGFNLVEWIMMGWELGENIVYGLVGVGGVIGLWKIFD